MILDVFTGQVSPLIMAREFNPPPVVFPPAAISAPGAYRRPTAPAAAAAASTSYSSSSTIGDDGWGTVLNLESLEQLGINPKQIYQKTISILSPFHVRADIQEDADLWGPILFLMAFWLFQLLAGKLHFGIITGWATVASLFLYVVFNRTVGEQGNLGILQCLSLIGYCTLPVVMLSAAALFVPRGGMVIMAMAVAFVTWSARACTGLLVELASHGDDEHRRLIAYACFFIYSAFSLLVIF